MKKVVVTGAYGFLGRNLSRLLAAEGFHVTGLGHGVWDRDEWKKWGLSDWHVADITLESLLTYAGDPEMLFHCAGSGSVSFSMTHPAQDYQRTVGSTLAVLEFARVYRRSLKLIFPSSAGVYGAVARMPIAINGPMQPTSPYGVHKKIAEDLCRSYGTHFGVESSIIRLFSVYGIGIRKQLLWDACDKISVGNTEFFGTGEETRDWIHVDDAARLLLLAASSTSRHAFIANGGGGEALTVREVLQAIADQFAAGPVSFSGTPRPGDPVHYQADISESSAIGWQPTKDWRSEIKSYVEWYRRGAP